MEDANWKDQTWDQQTPLCFCVVLDSMLELDKERQYFSFTIALFLVHKLQQGSFIKEHESDLDISMLPIQEGLVKGEDDLGSPYSSSSIVPEFQGRNCCRTIHLIYFESPNLLSFYSK